MFDLLMAKLAKDPHRLFLIDGLGALLSVFLLGYVLVQLQEIVGMPVRTLYILASIPILFAIYDFICYTKLSADLSQFLRYIAFANIVYCLFSLVMLVNHKESLTFLGMSYFIIEILIVLVLAYIELRISKFLNG